MVKVISKDERCLNFIYFITLRKLQFYSHVIDQIIERDLELLDDQKKQSLQIAIFNLNPELFLDECEIENRQLYPFGSLQIDNEPLHQSFSLSLRHVDADLCEEITLLFNTD